MILFLALAACHIDQGLSGKPPGPGDGDTASADSGPAQDSDSAGDSGASGDNGAIDTAPPPPPDIVVSPEALTWSADGSTPADQTFSITNVGDGPLTLDRLELVADSVFTVTVPDGIPFPRTLASGDSFPVVVSDAGVGTGDVHVYSDDPDEPDVPVTLSAEGCRADPFFTESGWADPYLIDVYYSNGDGTFAPPLTIGTNFGGGHTGQIQTDLDGDGLNEIISVDGRSYEVTIAQCDPDTGHWGEVGTGTYLYFYPSAVGDLNGDGIDDVAGYDTRLNGYSALGNGDGTFTAHDGASWHADSADMGYRQGMAHHMRDLDGDGIADIAYYAYATGGAGSTRIGIFSGVGDGRFRKPESYLYTPQIGNGIDIADLDGDGYEDLVVGTDDDGDPGSARTLLHPAIGASGAFEAFDVVPAVESGSDSPGAGTLWVADYTRDGVPDVLAAWYTGPWVDAELDFLGGLGDGTFAPPSRVLGVGHTWPYVSVGP